jgi:hypothetical protein
MAQDNVGIYMDGGSEINISGNVISLDTTGSTAQGIYLYDGNEIIGSNNNTIEYNNITAAIRGIDISLGSNNTITRNIINSTNYGVYLTNPIGTSANTEKNNFTYNTITGENSFAGFYFIDGDISHEDICTYVAHNNITTTGVGAMGFNLFIFSECTFENNTITTSGADSHGIKIQGGQNNTFISNSITVSGNSTGLWIDDNAPISIPVSNFTFYDMLINSSNYSVYISSANVDINDIFLVNVSYIGTNKSERVSSVEDISELTRKWYLDVTVSSIEDANTTLTNSTGGTSFSLLTNSSGQIARQTLLEYVNSNNTITYYNNYSLSTTKSGYNSNTTTFNLSEYSNNAGNKDIEITLTATSTPPSGGGGSSSGGGGTVSFWTSTISEDDMEFSEKGIITKELTVKSRIKIKFNGEEHFVGIINLTNITATINVSSTPQQEIFYVGDEKKFDLEGDGFYDILVSLNSIENNKANVSLNYINEQYTESLDSGTESEESGESGAETGKSEDDSGGNNIPLWVVIVLIIILFLWFVIRHKKPNKRRKSFNFYTKRTHGT